MAEPDLNSHLPLMAGFNRWANRELYAQVAKLPAEVYASAQGLFFSSVHDTLNHLLLVDILWRCRIQAAAHPVVALDQQLHADFAALSAARREEDAHLIELVNGLDAAGVNRSVRFTRLDGKGEQQLTVGVILMTLFNHQTHHRGQVHAVLTRQGIWPPSMDVVDYLLPRG